MAESIIPGTLVMPWRWRPPILLSSVQDLLAEVLANQDDNVDAARAALCSMGLREQPQQPPQPSLHRADETKTSMMTEMTTVATAAPRTCDRGGGGGGHTGPKYDPWFWTDEPGDTDLVEDPGSVSLFGRRCANQPERSHTGSTGPQPAGSFNGGGAGLSRPWSVVMVQQQQELAAAATTASPYRSVTRLRMEALLPRALSIVGGSPPPQLGVGYNEATSRLTSEHLQGGAGRAEED